MKEFDIFEAEALAELASAADTPALEDWKARRLGKKGPLSEALKRLKDLPEAERREAGVRANALKERLARAFEARSHALAERAIATQLEGEWLDLSAPVVPARAGHLHPLTVVARELEDIFIGMGFSILDGPLVEDDWHNFEALNIPPGHPARDMQDTFFTTAGAVLRTHTSSVQIRTLEKYPPPLRGVAPGRVFRCEELDASHEHTFYQIEGLVVDRDISVAHMLYFLKTMLAAALHRDVEVRLRHSYFPFVEPGFELDLRCSACTGKGCSVCKQSGWIETLGCGLVHPKVFKACKLDADEWSGFAFGLGLSRLVMNRYGIDDIRHFMSGDLRFVRQLGG